MPQYDSRKRRKAFWTLKNLCLRPPNFHPEKAAMLLDMGTRLRAIAHGLVPVFSVPGHCVESLSLPVEMVRVTFIHPDLGIGGAERLVVDAGLALKSRGHDVHFVTAHHDCSHCFEETRDGTLNVTAVGDWLPRQSFGRFYAFWAYVRMIYVAFYLIFFSRLRPDVVICDQVSACIPVLKLGKAKVIFYCHFPDMLLTQRRTLLKKLYRAPIDWLEEFTTGTSQSH